MRGALLAALLLTAAGTAAGADAWAFRFEAATYNNSWHDDLSFHNTTGQDAVVHLIGVSNGAINEGDLLDVPIPAGRTVSLTDLFGVWDTDQFPELWVVHFDAPDGILVSSRGGLNFQCPSPCGQPPNPFPDLGAFTMPVFRSLSSSGVRQFHFGADLGKQTTRSNVGIYNAGDADATAVVSLYRACDDVLLATRVATIPANTAAQVGIRASAEIPACSDPQKLNVWLNYVTVVVDQPSASYVFNLLEDPAVPLPRLPFGVAGD
jgi:hypothetical protein